MRKNLHKNFFCFNLTTLPPKKQKQKQTTLQLPRRTKLHRKTTTSATPQNLPQNQRKNQKTDFKTIWFRL